MKKIIYTLITLILIYIIGDYLYSKYQIANCSRYSIAQARKIHGSMKTGYGMEYTFLLNGIEINNSDGIKSSFKESNDDFYILNRRYVVKFSCKNPNVAQILWEIEVPYNINAPVNGWDKIPYGLDKVRE